MSLSLNLHVCVSYLSLNTSIRSAYIGKTASPSPLLPISPFSHRKDLGRTCATTEVQQQFLAEIISAWREAP